MRSVTSQLAEAATNDGQVVLTEDQARDMIKKMPTVRPLYFGVTHMVLANDNAKEVVCKVEEVPKIPGLASLTVQFRFPTHALVAADTPHMIHFWVAGILKFSQRVMFVGKDAEVIAVEAILRRVKGKPARAQLTIESPGGVIYTSSAILLPRDR